MKLQFLYGSNCLITDPVYRAFHLFLGPSVLDSRYRDFLSAVEHDKLEKDQYPYSFVDKIYNISMYSAIITDRTEKLTISSIEDKEGLG
jgi:hypothetical protein